MSLTQYLGLPFAQHALAAAALVALACGLIGPFVITRGMAFAVHGTSELAFTGAAAGLLVADNAIAGALVGAVVVGGLIGALGVRERERDSSIGVILAAGMGLGVLLLGFYHGFATEATNILFGDIFGVSSGQLLLLGVIAVAVTVAMAAIYRPLLFASVDPEVAVARGVPVRLLGIVFLFILAFTVTEAAQVVGTLLVLSLAITPAAAAHRLANSPLVVAILSVVFALVAADGGLLGASRARRSDPACSWSPSASASTSWRAWWDRGARTRAASRARRATCQPAAPPRAATTCPAARRRAAGRPRREWRRERRHGRRGAPRHAPGSGHRRGAARLAVVSQRPGDPRRAARRRAADRPDDRLPSPAAPRRRRRGRRAAPGRRRRALPLLSQATPTITTSSAGSAGAAPRPSAPSSRSGPTTWRRRSATAT